MQPGVAAPEARKTLAVEDDSGKVMDSAGNKRFHELRRSFNH